MKISIITICYNAVDTIEKTILSVINQDYNDIEYIVIDGGSSDGTTDIIKKYENNIAYWISEPDKGIYDAMNKGIKAATGEWINFMNSGDTFIDNNIISRIGFENLNKDIAYVYGDNLDLHDDGKLTYYKAKSHKNVNRGIFCCHQSSFVSTKNKDLLLFDTRYRISADYNQQLSLYRSYGGKAFYYFPYPVSVYEIDNGISSKARSLLYKEKFYIHIRNKCITGVVFDTLYYIKSLLTKLIRKN